MYFVHYSNGFLSGYSLRKFETVDEAKDFMKGLADKGHRDFHLSQEIPLKINIEVEI